MRRRTFKRLVILSGVVITAVWLWARRPPLSGGRPVDKGMVQRPEPPRKPDASAPTLRSRLFVLAINGGGSPEGNRQSHLLHLQGVVDALRKSGVPAERVTVLAGDGPDPTPDLLIKEEAIGAQYWRFRGTPMEGEFPPPWVLGNSEVKGATLYPATRASLSIWLLTVGQQLRAGDELLLYVTDHGSKGKNSEDNSIVLWGPGQKLSVRDLREALGTLDPSVRVVALMSQCYSGGFANLISLGGAEGEATGRFCGFFSTTADRLAYGSYPETRASRKTGHSFAFLQALPVAAGRFALAEELALEYDDTPDVPVRTSDLYLSAALKRAARTRGIPPRNLWMSYWSGRGQNQGRSICRLNAWTGSPPDSDYPSYTAARPRRRQPTYEAWDHC